MGMAVRLGDLLVRNGVLSEQQRDEVLTEQMRSGRPFGELAERMFNVAPRAIEGAWAEQYALISPRVDPLEEEADPRVLGMIDRRQAWQFRLLPLRYDGFELMVCTTQENLVRALKFVGWRFGHPCFLAIAEPLVLGRALERHYPFPGLTAESLVAPAAAVARR
jgi:hypothetical protein